jgi:hypothetical protein
MEKTTLSYYPSSQTGTLQLLNPDVLEKTAGVSEDIINYLQALTPKPEHSYALINALSGGEHWGSNLNGDWFDEDELTKYHKTFEALGHIYELHQNKDPKKSMGKVLHSYYNPKMHRVELIVEFNNDKAKKVLDRLNAGELLATSMGTRVSHEKCSICGHISKTLAQRCDHLKKEMNRIYPDGRKVFAYNYAPKFFDISIVRIPADKTSRVVRMIRIDESPDGSEKKLVIFEKKLDSNAENPYNKVASLEANAEISKEIPAKLESSENAATPKELAQLIKKRLSNDVLYKLSEYPLVDTLSTMLALRIMPAPQDFQKLALLSFGDKELAERLDNENIIFDSKIPDNVLIMDNLKLDTASEKIAKILSDEIPETSNLELWELSRALEKISYYKEDGTWYPDGPSQEERSTLGKLFFDKEDEPQISPVKNPIVPLGILGSLYYGFSKVFKTTSEANFKGFLTKYPWLLPVVIGGAALATTTAQDIAFKKEANFGGRVLKSGLISFPLAYYFSGDAEYRARKGEQITEVENFVRKHPTLVGVLGTMAGSKIQKLIKNRKFLKTKSPDIIKISQLLINTDIKVLEKIQKDLMEVI